MSSPTSLRLARRIPMLIALVLTLGLGAASAAASVSAPKIAIYAFSYTGEAGAGGTAPGKRIAPGGTIRSCRIDRLHAHVRHSGAEGLKVELKWWRSGALVAWLNATWSAGITSVPLPKNSRMRDFVSGRYLYLVQLRAEGKLLASANVWAEVAKAGC